MGEHDRRTSPDDAGRDRRSGNERLQHGDDVGHHATTTTEAARLAIKVHKATSGVLSLAGWKGEKLAPTPAAHGTRPVLAANQAPIFVYGGIRGSILIMNISSPCPYSERAPPANSAGAPKTKRTWVMCDFTSENKEEKGGGAVESYLPPIFCGLYTRGLIEQFEARISLVFTGISRVLMPNTGRHDALEKIALGWRLAWIFFSTIPKTLRPGSRLMVVYWAYAGVGQRKESGLPGKLLK